MAVKPTQQLVRSTRIAQGQRRHVRVPTSWVSCSSSSSPEVPCCRPPRPHPDLERVGVGFDPATEREHRRCDGQRIRVRAGARRPGGVAPTSLPLVALDGHIVVTPHVQHGPAEPRSARWTGRDQSARSCPAPPCGATTRRQRFELIDNGTLIRSRILRLKSSAKPIGVEFGQYTSPVPVLSLTSAFSVRSSCRSAPRQSRRRRTAFRTVRGLMRYARSGLSSTGSTGDRSG